MEHTWRCDIRVTDLGEFGIIARIVGRLPQSPAVLLGPGDDAAVLIAPDGRVVVTTDLLLEGRHFRRDWSSAQDIGRKAAAQNLSDVVAMGADPTALFVGLGLPGDLPAAWLDGLTDGFREECALVGASVAGGDVVRSELVVLGVTALGDLGGRAPVTRSGARPGQVLAVAGRLGHAAAGLALYQAGNDDPAFAALAGAHRRPLPPYACGPAAAALGATAMLDVSDGLLQDLGHVARASGVLIDLDPAALEVPETLAAAGAALGVDPLRWMLTGGEDHALAAVFPAEVTLPSEWRPIGRVLEGEGVQVTGYEGLPAGWDHFRE
ncbi:thiamine-phosphate kinase [Sphaerisporangium sp. TRM90804]|uniref:thiamine-phosphate kinase n=1 Tax=Sphaerisporangium sp. TRM90804 TaxID=3031113 RepID=UPI00244ABD4A|nr:thiamine-phosphate kinase [Sphaerisporangium sp. TRM90804]MDH2427600.1 thiamine-phosphate kinase [Sphaerisporangium sp. TRM90804]